MKKKERQAILKEIITKEQITTQDDLLEKLAKENIVATQATISRDIRELKIIKVRNDKGQMVYRLYEEKQLNRDHLKEMIQEMVEKISQVQFLTILHTTTSSADLVAALIDEMQMAEITATMAGTDTLLIISPNEEQAKYVAAILRELHEQ